MVRWRTKGSQGIKRPDHTGRGARESGNRFRQAFPVQCGQMIDS